MADLTYSYFIWLSQLTFVDVCFLIFPVIFFLVFFAGMEVLLKRITSRIN